MTLEAIRTHIDSADFAARLDRLYGAQERETQRVRWQALLAESAKHLPAGDIGLFSAPGRTELGGNHTDHQRGCVLAAAVQLDTIAVAVPRSDSLVQIWADGYPAFVLDISSTSPMPEEKSTSMGLVRGVADFFVQHGKKVGGFAAVVSSTVLRGSGLSSSAAFEVLMGGILSGFYHDGKVDPVFLARAGQFAENVHFGKPCGLMDQAASAVGGIIGIDFRDPANPVIDKVALDPEKTGHRLAVVDTGGNHADLTDDYSGIPAEMRAVARALGGVELRDIEPAALTAALGSLRATVGDRALLRALHFQAENKRARDQLAAVSAGDFKGFLRLVQDSGHSSLLRLQNINPTHGDGSEQGIGLALALAQDILAGEGAYRVHGGGFAGTIQAWVPAARWDAFVSAMEGVFGKGKVCGLRLRPDGVVRL
jgi:galactokinase